MPRTTFLTDLGRCGVAWNERGVEAFRLPPVEERPDDVVPSREIAALIERVQRHMAGTPQDFSDLTFDWSLVPEFDAAVLRATLAVKAGETSSYGRIAVAAGQTTAASRAVGRALGANRWPLLIPCHRVVSASGKMTGFSGPGGIQTKLRLLTIEGTQLFAE